MLKKDARILVVDDFETVRMILSRSLNELGYKHVDEAVEGADALKMLKEAQVDGKPYSVAFCDINMPKVNGLEVLRQIKEDPKLSSIAVIMVTAESEEEPIVEAMKLGALDYIIKPFSPESLQKKLEHVSKSIS